MGILEIKNLTCQVEGRKLLDNLEMDIWENHIHAIIGPNGAGKSTLASTIMGIPEYRTATGDILFNGRKINDMEINQRAELGITLAWQEPARFEGLKTELFLKSSARNKQNGKIRESLELVGLKPEDYLNRAVDRTLSGGERKRIELASIFLMEPKLVLLDEPDSGIDVGALEKIFDMIRILKQRGTTIILITHSMTVLKQAEHAFLICRGRIMDKGSVEKISAFFREKCIPCDGKQEDC